MLEIPEILENVLRLTDAETQLLAWNVCHMWRDTIKIVLEQVQKNDTAARPIGFGELISADILPLMKATQSELAELEVQVQSALERILTWSKRGKEQDIKNNIVWFPARLTQATNIPPSVSLDIRVVHGRQCARRGGLLFPLSPEDYNARSPELAQLRYRQDLEDAPPAWLDLTQVQINPHFAELVSERINFSNGKWQITLRPARTPHCAIIRREQFPQAPLKRIESLFVTDPPVKALDLQVWVPKKENPHDKSTLSIRSVADDAGVRIGQLLSAIEGISEDAIKHWLFFTWIHLRKAIEEGHGRRDLWFYPPVPTVTIALKAYDGDSVDEWLAANQNVWGTWKTSQSAMRDYQTRRQEWVPLDRSAPDQEHENGRLL